MRRRAFDILASGVGLVLVGVLIVAGALMLWGNSYVNSNVHNQLA
jgi:lipopolysaccharide/colanic/teichoic acid biosynthesis glycosyltransferase